MLYFAGCISTSTVQKNNKYYILLTLFYAIFRCSHIDNRNILWYIRIIIVLCAPFAGLLSASHTLLSLYLRSTMLPSEIRATAPLYFNDYAARNSLAAVSTCTPPCRHAMMYLHLRRQAFRSEQSRHGWKALSTAFRSD